MMAGLFSCSKQELVTQSDNIEAIDAIVYVDKCAITSFNFGEAGNISVKNDRDFIYYTFTANNNYFLSQVSLHYTAEVSGFPTNNGGNILPKNFLHQKTLAAGVVNYEYKVPNSLYGYDLLVASNVTFQNSAGEAVSFWAGDIAVKKGNWAYFNYNVQVPPYNAGNDKSRVMTISQAKALPSWDETRKAFTSMLDPGVPEGQKVGTFEPSIWEIINKFHDPNVGGVGTYTTVYTLGTENCFDSVILTINIVEDNL